MTDADEDVQAIARLVVQLSARVDALERSALLMARVLEGYRQDTDALADVVREQALRLMDEDRAWTLIAASAKAGMPQ